MRTTPAPQDEEDMSSQPTTMQINNSASKQTMDIMLKSLSFEPLLNRDSTFWPSAQELLAKHPSFEFMNPDHDSELRKSSPVSAIANLVATVCGGGVLTLPIAFARAGIIPSTVMMIISAIITDFAMYILCSCARRTGGKSYGDVTRIAFGLKAEIAVTVLLFVFLIFVIVAYMVLVKDIWTPLIMHIWPFLKSWCVDFWGIDPDQSKLPSDIFLVAFIICSLPLLFKKDLYALRHTCYVGFVSLILLILAIMQRSYELNCVSDVGIFGKKVKWYSNDINDLIYAFPIISLSFFSIYNVLSVHSALVNPTRERVKFVLDGTIVICLVLFYIVGLFGYLYAYEEARDNILLNFPMTFKIVLIGRLGYGFTLMFGLPLVFLPCREALLTIPILVSKLMNEGEIDTQLNSKPSVVSTKNARMSGVTKEGHVVINGIDFDEERPLLKRNSSIIPMKIAVKAGTIIPMRQLVTGGVHYGSTNPSDTSSEKPARDVDESPKTEGDAIKQGEKTGIQNESASNEQNSFNFKNGSTDGKRSTTPKCKLENTKQGKVEVSNTIHVLSTLCIIAFGYACAVAVPGVGLVWSICGSSMSLIIGFFIPAACYLKIRSRKRLNPRSLAAWAMLIFSILACVVCTTHVVADAKKLHNV